MKRKFLSILLTLAMALTLLPVSAMAEGETAEAPAVTKVAKVGDAEYATLAKAVEHAKTGDTIVMTAATDISKTGLSIASDKDITLDLNGYEVKAANTGAGNIKVYGKLTLKDSTDTSANGEGQGKITTVTKTYIRNQADQPIIYAVNGDFVMQSGLIDTATGITNNSANGQFGVGVQNETANASVTIEGGKIKAGWYAVAGNGTLLNHDGNITVNGGILESTADYAIYHPHTGTTTINGGTVYGAAGGVSLNCGKLVVNGGTITSKGTGTTGDWGDGTGKQDAAAINVNAKYETTSVEIKGGKITAEKDAILLTNGKDGTIAVSGGTFSSAVMPEYCADGFVPTKNPDGSYGVKVSPPVEVWTGYSLNSSSSRVACYETLAEAIENLNGKKWILIAKDYTLSKNFTIPTDVHVDVKSGATLTVAEGATLTVAADANRLAVLTGGSIVNNGTIMVCGSKGKVMIDGTLTGKLSVPEGYFLDNNKNNYFATENSKALYEVTYIDGTVKKTADRSHVNENATQVKLLKDVEVGSWVLSNAADNFVLDLGGHTLSGSKSSGYYVLYAGVNMTIKNGTIKYNAGSEKGAICVYNGATVTIDSTATIDGGSGIGIMMQGETPSHVVLNGTVTTTGAYGFASNGSANSDGNPDTCNITVNAGATIKASKGFAIYHPTLGTVTVNGGTISGHTGIEMCAGKLVVSGGSITSTGDNTDATGSQNAILDGAAISIINRNYPGGVPTAEITGGTIKATGTGMTVKAYDYKNDTVASWTDVSNYVNISGGTFSSIPDNMNALCAAGYIPFKNADGTYGVTRPSSGSSGSYDPTYSVSTPSKTENGSVTVSPKSASKGDTVTVTVKPDSGYVLETLTVTDKNGNELTLKDKGNGKYIFTMPAGKVEVKATFMEDNSMLNFFYDVPNGAYFYEAVKWAVENGITTGVGNDLFAPEQPCTRSQIVTFLWRAAGSPEPKSTAAGMTDVVPGSYYAKAVAWAVENGITTGTAEGTFSPDATCTRAQAVTFLARAQNAKATGKTAFSDVPADSYFADAVAWAQANGVTTGTSETTFSPDNDCTRAQIVTFLYRANQGT